MQALGKGGLGGSTVGVPDCLAHLCEELGQGLGGPLTDFQKRVLASSEWDEAERYAAALQHCTPAEPLPWSDSFVARRRALAFYHRGIRMP